MSKMELPDRRIGGRPQRKAMVGKQKGGWLTEEEAKGQGEVEADDPLQLVPKSLPEKNKIYFFFP